MNRRRVFILSAVFVISLLGADRICAGEDEDTALSGRITYDVLDDRTAEVTGYTYLDSGEYVLPSETLSDLVIPEEIDGYVVSGIGEGAFRNYRALTHVRTPSSLVSIGKYAFSECDSIREFFIPDNITQIDADAFYQCGGLEFFFMTPDHPVYAALDGVLYEKESKRLVCYPAGKADTSFRIPDNILEIGPYAFHGCTALSEITIASTVKKIGSGAFRGCTGLTDFTIPNTVEEIDSNPFWECSELQRFHISPDHPCFADIDEVLFDKTTKRLISFPGSYWEEEYTIPEGIAEIGSYAFADCYDLQKVAAPSTLVSVADHAFENCAALSPIRFSEGLTSIGNAAFSGCAEFVDFTLPATVSEIGDSVFSGCISLKKVVIPDGVKKIGKYLFRDCYMLSDVVIPGSVKEIGKGAFEYCAQISVLKIPSSVEKFGENIFKGQDKFMYLLLERKSEAVEYAREYEILYTYEDADKWLYE